MTLGARISGWALLGVFCLALFTSAALMFSVQPMVGKMLLPIVGGTPAGWIVAMAFFQLALLAGYTIAYGLSRLPAQGHAIAYIVLLALGGALLPVHISADSTQHTLDAAGTVFISVRDSDKNVIIPLAARLADMGFTIVATGGTARHLVEAGIRARKVNKVHEGQPHVIDSMINGDIHLMLNTTDGPQAVADDFNLRRSALMNNIPYYTTIAGARAAVDAIASLRQNGPFDVKSLQDHLAAA